MDTEKGMWDFKLTVETLSLLVICVLINYTGQFASTVIRLPIWLDVIGTLLAGMILGPVGGMIAGFFDNFIFGFFNPISLMYMSTSVVMGACAGLFARSGLLRSWAGVMGLGGALALLGAIISTPTNVIVMEGRTASSLGDAVFLYFLRGGWALWVSSFFGEIVVDVIDKLLSAAAAYLILRNKYTRGFLARYFK
jgi:energy-coupling factor transport system substrate-specific component